MASRVVCIAFDSPDLGVLQRGIDEGWMPVLADIVERGRFVPIEDHQELMTSPSWPTFVRGCSFAEHQLFRDFQLEAGTYNMRSVDASAARRPPFWADIGDAGLRSTVVSIYSAPRIPGLPGTQVCGWGSHDPFHRDLANWSDPPGLIESLEREVGKRGIHYGFDIPRNARENRALRERCIEGCRQQTRALLRLLEDTEWDFFFGAYSDCHDAGHYLRHFGDLEDPDRPPDTPDDLTGSLSDIYREVDAGLGEIVKRLPGDACLLVVTPYCMGPYPHAEAAVVPVLERAGLLSRVSPGERGGRLSALAWGRRAVRATVPPPLRRALGRVVPRERWLNELMYADIDWEGTSAFPLIGDGCAAIRLNVAGREPVGTVAPGEEYDSVCDQLKTVFGELVAVDDGLPVAEEVTRFDELFGVAPGPSLPDVAVRWRARYRVPGVRSARLGEVSFTSTDSRLANHVVPGFIIGLGDGIEPSGSARLDGAPAQLVDLAATVLTRLGLELPETLSGRPIEALGAVSEPSRPT